MSRWMQTPQSNNSMGELFDNLSDPKGLRPVRDTSEGVPSSKAGPTCCGLENRHEENALAQDVCVRKHKGNPESVEAFRSIKDRLTRNQNAVLRVIKERGEHGATTDEIADHFGVGQNVVSGRVSELHFRLHKIEKIGTRPTRNGHPAAVWKAV